MRHRSTLLSNTSKLFANFSSVCELLCNKTASIFPLAPAVFIEGAVGLTAETIVSERATSVRTINLVIISKQRCPYRTDDNSPPRQPQNNNYNAQNYPSHI